MGGGKLRNFAPENKKYLLLKVPIPTLSSILLFRESGDTKEKRRVALYP